MSYIPYTHVFYLQVSRSGSAAYRCVEIIIVIFVEHYPYPVKSKLTCPLNLIFFLFCPLNQRTCRTSSPFNNWKQHLRIIVGNKGFKIIGFGFTSLTYNKKTDYFGPHFFSTLLSFPYCRQYVIDHLGYQTIEQMITWLCG